MVSKVIDELTKMIKSLGIDAMAELQGSIAHKTWVSNERDIDIFILFSTNYALDEIKRVGLELGKEVSHGKWRERYAEHPFIEATIDDYRVDIVPCYKISEYSERITAVDRTPLHTEYLSERIGEKNKDEIILLKSFMKGIGVYGAELKVRGFSGYLCELLTLYYGSFEGVLRGALRWKTQEVIDIAEHYAEEETVVTVFKEPLIIIDPVDPTRNVAAAVSSDRIADLKAAARAFIQDPSPRFFRPPEVMPLSTKEIERLIVTRKTDTLFIQFPCHKISPDILWGELGKSAKTLKRIMELHDFTVIGYDAWSDEDSVAVIVLELTSVNLPSIAIHEGPFAGHPSQERFLEKHLRNVRKVAGPWIKDGKWQVELEREHANAKHLIETKLTGENLSELGLSRDIAEWIKEGIKVTLNEEILPLYSSNAAFRRFLTKYYTKRPDWLF